MKLYTIIIIWLKIFYKCTIITFLVKTSTLTFCAKSLILLMATIISTSFSLQLKYLPLFVTIMLLSSSPYNTLWTTTSTSKLTIFLSSYFPYNFTYDNNDNKIIIMKETNIKNMNEVTISNKVLVFVYINFLSHAY